MPRWTDVRVPTNQLHEAVRAIVDAFQPVSFIIDHHPPAAVEEAEITAHECREREVVGALARAGVRVLAHRSRIGADASSMHPAFTDGGWTIAS